MTISRTLIEDDAAGRAASSSPLLHPSWSKNDHDRLDAIVHLHGLAAGIGFALRTMRAYRRCVLMTGKHSRKWHFASIYPFRERFIRSYCFHKHWLEVTLGPRCRAVMLMHDHQLETMVAMSKTMLTRPATAKAVAHLAAYSGQPKLIINPTTGDSI